MASRFAAVYYDGIAPVRHPVSVEIGPSGLLLTAEDREPFRWDYGDVRVVADGAYGEPVRIERGVAEALVVESHDFPEALRQHNVLPQPAIRLDLRGWPAVLLCCVAIAIIASALYGLGLTLAGELAARFMPPSVEDRIGRSVSLVLAPKEQRCLDSGAQLGIAPIVDRLRAASGSRQTFSVIYTNNADVNAFAAPGGYIIVFRGLLDNTESPEEFAGVLAHEMQHVLHRHATRAIAREFGGRALLSLMSVDTSGTPAAIQASAHLANLSYQRDDETEADITAVNLMARAGIDPRGLPRFLRRLTGVTGGTRNLTYLSTHPALSDRISALDDTIQRVRGTAAPLMNRGDWLAARSVCGGN